MTLRIPKLREGMYFPEDVVARWSRTDTALASAVCDMWAAGISTRKVEAVASDLGLESMSRSRVSRLCEGLDGEVAELRGADLSSVNVNPSFTDSTNAIAPIAPTHPRRFRRRQAPFPASRSGARSFVR